MYSCLIQKGNISSSKKEKNMNSFFLVRNFGRKKEKEVNNVSVEEEFFHIF